MASMFSDLSGPEIRLLDPGSGMGSLSASVCQEILDRCVHPELIQISSYEIDPEFSEAQEEVLASSLSRLKRKGIQGTKNIHNDDFILKTTEHIGNDLFSTVGNERGFTHVIMDPPYKKNVDRAVNCPIRIDWYY